MILDNVILNFTSGKKERSPASVGRPALCNLNYEPGDCDAAFPMFFFNKDKGVCEKFTWGGCGGNLNKFEKKEDCEKTCIALVGYGGKYRTVKNICW